MAWAPTLAGLVFEAAARTPNAQAVIAGQRHVSYGELDALVRALCETLAELPLHRGDIVAVALERTPESVALLCALAALGVAFVPLDPFAPRARLATMLADARPAFLIVARTYAALISSGALAALELEDVVERARSRRATPPAPQPPAPNDLAYVLYTSGSTGIPKGVMVEHRSVVNTLRCVRDEFAYAPGDRIYQLAAWTFDPAMLQIFGTLAAGASLVLSTTGDRVDLAALVDELVEQRITVFDTVPALLGPLLDEPRLREASLRLIGCGGAVVRGQLRDRVRAVLDVPIQNHYGPTECAILATTYRTEPGDTDERVPIGTPIAGTTAYVLDADGAPAPHDTDGELYLGGAGVARGYLNAPELTAARFLPDPFARDSGARMYRTGDIVRRRRDGTLDFVGRIDGQVKIRGVRVELEEVEHALASHAGVEHAVAFVDGGPDDETLVAFVASSRPPASLEAALSAHARETLPAAARPAKIVALDALPMLPSGKVDAAALRARLHAQRDVAVDGDTLHDTIARVWRDVLGHADFGIDDDFFAVGGNSLAAARVAAQIAVETERRVAVAVLFAHPTIDGLARAVRSQARGTIAPIVRVADGTKVPFFFLHGDYTGVGLYARRFGGRLDADRPLYILPPHGADGGAVPSSIAAMAADHLCAIRNVQPHGPYILGGYCMGAIVALEMARELTSAGEHVACVVTIDAHHIMPRSRVRRWLGALRRNSPWRAPAPALDVEHASDPATAHVEPAWRRIMQDYVWQPLAAPVEMLCSRDSVTDATIVRRWRPYLRSFRLQRIAGNHVTAVTHHVAETCAAMAAVLERLGA